MKVCINFHGSSCLGNAQSPMCLQKILLESRTTLVVPERSLGGFWHDGCLKDTLRNLYINFHISSYLESGPTPRFSKVSLKCHPWSLRGRWWFLREVLVVCDILDVPYIHPGRSVSIFMALAAWEMSNLLCVSRTSSWILRGRWWFLRGVLVVFDMTDVSKIH